MANPSKVNADNASTQNGHARVAFLARDGNKRPNSIDWFTTGEWISSEPLPRETPDKWVRRMIRRRYTGREYVKRFKTDEDLVRACKKMGADWASWTRANAPQQTRSATLQSVSDSDLATAASLLLDIRRGYGQAEVLDRTLEIKQRRREEVKILQRYLRVTRQRLKTRRVMNAEHLRFRFEQNKRFLLKAIGEIRAVSPTREAHRQLTEAASPLMTKALQGLRSINLSSHRWLLKHLDPSLIEFPFRFLVNLSVPSYDRLHALWKQGQSEDDILDELSSEFLNAEFIESVTQSMKGGPFGADGGRLRALGELAEAVRNGLWQAAALLAVSQCEGLIWSYSRYLTRRGILICRTIRGKSYPYVWDFSLNDYCNKDPRTGRPIYDRRSQVTSARNLLKGTLFRLVLHVDLWDWLLDVFFDKRNSLMHGEMTVDQRMVTQALLALHEIVYVIDDFESERKSGRDWRVLP